MNTLISLPQTQAPKKIYLTNDDGEPEPLPYIFFRYVPTMSLAEASLITYNDLEEYLTGDCYYFFNRLVSKEQGKGGGKIVLKQLLEYIDKVGIPLANVINPYGNLAFDELLSFYLRYGFVKTSQESLVIYYPKTKL